MRELRFNMKYLLTKKELYLAILIILLINFVHVLLVIRYNINMKNFVETASSGEYQFILNNPEIAFNPVYIIIIPILCTMILADSNWIEKSENTISLLNMKIDYKKNIICRFFLSIIIVTFIVFIGFLANYLTLRYIFGSGQIAWYYQENVFNMLPGAFFLDNIRAVNPVKYVMLISMHVSFLIGLLAAFTYSISFYIKQKIVLHFIPFLMIIVTGMLFSKIGLGSISIINQLQPGSIFTPKDAYITYTILFLLSVILLCFHFRKKDMVL